jgi:hypothetical protein
VCFVIHINLLYVPGEVHIDPTRDTMEMEAYRGTLTGRNTAREARSPGTARQAESTRAHYYGGFSQAGKVRLAIVPGRQQADVES